VLDQQRLADKAQDAAALSAGRAALGGKGGGEGLDSVEDPGHAALVTRQGHALRQHIGDDQQVFRRGLAKLDRAAAGDLLVLVGPHDDGRRLLVRMRLGCGNPTGQAAQRLGAEEDGRAIAEQGGDAALADAERQGNGRDDGLALKSGGVQPLAQ
jgi:hypothetical protein